MIEIEKNIPFIQIEENEGKEKDLDEGQEEEERLNDDESGKRKQIANAFSSQNQITKLKQLSRNAASNFFLNPREWKNEDVIILFHVLGFSKPSIEQVEKLNLNGLFSFVYIYKKQMFLFLKY